MFGKTVGFKSEMGGGGQTWLSVLVANLVADNDWVWQLILKIRLTKMNSQGTKVEKITDTNAKHSVSKYHQKLYLLITISPSKYNIARINSFQLGDKQSVY